MYFFKVLNTIFLHNLWLTVPLKRRFHMSQIVVITNFVMVSSIGINRVVCMLIVSYFSTKTCEWHHQKMYLWICVYICSLIRLSSWCVLDTQGCKSSSCEQQGLIRLCSFMLGSTFYVAAQMALTWMACLPWMIQTCFSVPTKFWW